MLKSKDGDFFVSDWLRNRNTIEFLEIWEDHNPTLNYGKFAIIKGQAGLNIYKISVKEWGSKRLNNIAISQIKILSENNAKYLNNNEKNI